MPSRTASASHCPKRRGIEDFHFLDHAVRVVVWGTTNSTVPPWSAEVTWTSLPRAPLKKALILMVPPLFLSTEFDELGDPGPGGISPAG